MIIADFRQRVLRHHGRHLHGREHLRIDYHPVDGAGSFGSDGSANSTSARTLGSSRPSRTG
jgi:hypothetical protein